MGAKLGVVLSSFRRPKGLQEAIDSIRSQTYPGFYCAIADDHSDDPEVERVINETLRKDHRFYALVGHRRFSIEEKIQVCSFSTHINTAMDSLEHRGCEAMTFGLDDAYFHPDRFRSHMEILASRPEVFLTWGEQWLVQYDASGVKIAERKQVPDQGLGERTMDRVRELLPRVNIIDHASCTHRRTPLRWGTKGSQTQIQDWLWFKKLLGAGHTFHHINVIGETKTAGPYEIGVMLNQGLSMADVVRARGGK